MAEAQTNESQKSDGENVQASSSGWSSWGSWLQAAKDKSFEVFDTVCKDLDGIAQTAKGKSAEVYDYVKRDLGEFSQTIQEEVATTANVLKEKLGIDETNTTAASLKRGVTSLLNTVSDAFYIPPDDDDEPIFFDRTEARLYALGCDPATFLVQPEGPEFESWLVTFNLEEHQEEIDKQLSVNNKLKRNYEQLVPDQVSEELFWTRFLYRAHIVHEEEAQRQVLRKEAQIRTQSSLQGSDINWDEDEVLSNDSEIPEDVQAKLLAEYEKECQEKGQSELKTKDSGDIVVVSRLSDSGRTSPSKESSESNEEDWERISNQDSKTISAQLK